METIALLVIIVGIALLVVEIFIPSFGITGALGIAAILGGVIMTADSFLQGTIMFIIILVIAILLMVVAYKFFASKKSPFVLKESLNEEEKKDLEYFIGKKGKAVTPLRPAGTGEFDGVRLDILTKGEFIGQDEMVVVQKVEGKKIFVRKA